MFTKDELEQILYGLRLTRNEARDAIDLYALNRNVGKVSSISAAKERYINEWNACESALDKVVKALNEEDK